MPEEKQPIIPHHGSAIAPGGVQGGRIVGEMVRGALALSLAIEPTNVVLPAMHPTALATRFRIGEHEFCEPDYQQIILWAKTLKIAPMTLIERLLKNPETWEQRNKTQFSNGQIIKVWWDIGLLPLEYFEWVTGLIIESIRFDVPKRSLLIQTASMVKKLVTKAVNFSVTKKSEPLSRCMSLPLQDLQRLECSGMDLVGLDLSKTPRLTYLFCGFNDLASLNLEDVPSLDMLECHANKLTTLDLSAVPQLSSLMCYGNKLATLNLSAVPQLVSLFCHANKLASLDLTAVPLLKDLSCHKNQLASLDLSAVSQLIWLYCGDNQITELDLSCVPRLTEFACDKNQLASLNLSSVPQLERLWCWQNKITSLDLSRVPKLTQLSCAGNRLTSLNLSNVPLLTELECHRNQIAELDIRPLKKLEKLVYDKRLTRLIQRPDQHF